MDLNLADANWSTSPQPRKSTTQIPSSPKLLHSPTIGNTRRSFSASHSASSAPTTVRFNGTGNTSINKIRKRKKMADTEKEEAINLVSFVK